MTIQGAINELMNLLDVDDIPIHYKPTIEKVIDTIILDRARGKTDRKTENSSEKPNNCDEPTWEQVKEYCNKRCLDIVDSAMRKQWYKDEPQTKVETMSCEECKWYIVGEPCKPFIEELDCHYEPKDEPQTCNNCTYKGYVTRCRDCHDWSLWERFEDEPYTERSE